jgi:hypothetical protein
LLQRTHIAVYNAYVFHEKDGYAVVVRSMQAFSWDQRLVTMGLLVLGTVLRQLPVYARSRDLTKMATPIPHCVPMLGTMFTMMNAYRKERGVLCYGAFALGALLGCREVLAPAQAQLITEQVFGARALRCLADACAAFSGDYYLLSNALEVLVMMTPSLRRGGRSEESDHSDVSARSDTTHHWVREIERSVGEVDFGVADSQGDVARAKLYWQQWREISRNTKAS